MEKRISISYDKDADVLYLSFGKPTKSESEEIDEGVFARFDHRTKKLQGLTVVNFSKKFGGHHRQPKDLVVPAHI